MRREAGVRTLKKHLEKIYRKVALKLVQGGLGASSEAASSAEQAPSPEMRLESSPPGTVAPQEEPSPGEHYSCHSSIMGATWNAHYIENLITANKHILIEALGSCAGAAATASQLESTGSSAPSVFPEQVAAEEPMASTLEAEPAPGAASSGASSSLTSSSDSLDSSSAGSSGSGEAAEGKSGVERVLEGEPVRVDVGDLKGYLGQPPFTSDRIYDATPPGVVMGLAWCAPPASPIACPCFACLTHCGP
jgi:ATP-dependent Lon protease